jgi:dipeptide/tripeptide permease
MSARLTISILCLSGKGIGETISSVIANWYRDSGQWKAAFEAAIQIVVGTIIFMLLKLHCVSTGKR